MLQAGVGIDLFTQSVNPGLWYNRPMKKKALIGTALILGSLCLLLGGFVVGARSVEDAGRKVEQRLVEIFADDVVEVRQGRIVGACIAAQNDDALSEEWEELCSDILMELGDYPVTRIMWGRSIIPWE